jgi:hypothetical protein
MDPQSFRELLQPALSRTWDADTEDPDLRSLYTPDSHRAALDPDVTVVLGARGVGKTAWFKALQDATLRRVAADEYKLTRLLKIDPVPGYGSRRDPDRYPGPPSLAQLVEDSADTAEIWTAVLLHALGRPEVTGLDSWRDRVLWVRQNPERLDRALADADREAGERGILRLVLFDALDRTHASRQVADDLTGGVLRVALDLRTGTRNLRAKVFLRQDMFDSARREFPDSSKLTSNLAELRWSTTNLYGLLFHRLGNADSPLAGEFRATTPQWMMLDTERYVVPHRLAGDLERQRAVFTEIAGPYMGSDHRKGVTYTWLPNHLMDGIGQVSPRSFLRALSRAAEVTRTTFAGAPYALHPDGIRQGVQAASRIRVDEITEDLPWVAEAVTLLKGLQVPIEEGVVVDLWGTSGLANRLRDAANSEVHADRQVKTGPRSVDDYDGLIRELISLGVMSRRSDGRLDLPDVYRIAFDIGRKGGVPRVTRTTASP